jgi:quercetin dioxygenase-like cupin family protein
MITTATPAPEPRAEDAEARLDGPCVCFDVPHELARLRAARAYHVEGHAGRTLTKYPDLRVVLEAMKAGERQPLHETAERIAVHVIVGHVRVRLHGGAHRDLGEGSYAAFDAERVHELECVHECGFLLTVAWPPLAPGRAREDVEVDGAGI